MFILLKAKPFLTVVSIRFLFSADADVDARDYSGRKPKHYIKDRTSLWIQSKLTRMTSDRPSYHLPHRSSRGVETESALPLVLKHATLRSQEKGGYCLSLVARS